MPTWSTASDWDSNQEEQGVIHDSFGDHQADVVEQGLSPDSIPGLFSFFSFNEDINSGDSVATDYYGGNSANPSGGVSFGDTQFLNASMFEFDGSGAVTIPYESDYEPDSIVVGMIVNSDVTNDYQKLLTKQYSGDWNAPRAEYALSIFVDDEYAFQTNDGSGDVEVATSTGSNDVGQYRLVIGQADSSTLSIHARGQSYSEDNSRSINGIGYSGQNRDVIIGGRESGEYYTGSIQSAFFGNTLLSNSEIDELWGSLYQNASLTTGKKQV